MKTRKPMKFKTQFAKTEKFKKSAVLYMQNIANKLHEENRL